MPGAKRTLSSRSQRQRTKAAVQRLLVHDITTAQAEAAVSEIAREMTEATSEKLRSMLSGILRGTISDNQLSKEELGLLASDVDQSEAQDAR